jgi:hypothetical protein
LRIWHAKRSPHDSAYILRGKYRRNAISKWHEEVLHVVLVCNLERSAASLVMPNISTLRSYGKGHYHIFAHRVAA